MTIETGVLFYTKDLVPGHPVLDGHSCVEGIARACLPASYKRTYIPIGWNGWTALGVRGELLAAGTVIWYWQKYFQSHHIFRGIERLQEYTCAID